MPPPPREETEQMSETQNLEGSDANVLTPENEARIQQIIDRTYEKYRHVEDGDVATYIPELAKANPNHFGICLATVDGEIFRAADCEVDCTTQSMCKPFALQLALEQHGL